MSRKIALTLALGLAVPTAALACSDTQVQANKAEAEQQAILLAQADTTKPAKKSAKKSKAKKRTTTKADTMK